MAAIVLYIVLYKEQTKNLHKGASSGSIEKKGGIAKIFLIFFHFFIGFVSLLGNQFREMALGRGYGKSYFL